MKLQIFLLCECYGELELLIRGNNLFCEANIFMNLCFMVKFKSPTSDILKYTCTDYAGERSYNINILKT